MSQDDDSGGDEIRRGFSSQLKKFDEELSNFRAFYESHSTEEREDLRRWLTQIEDIQRAGRWNMLIRLQTEYDEVDDEGETIGWADAVFTPTTMLKAITAWERGEQFTPSSVLP